MPNSTNCSKLDNPLVPLADSVLHVPCPKDHFSLAPAMSVLDALLAEIGRKAPGPSKTKLRKLWKAVTQAEIAVRPPGGRQAKAP